MLSWRFVVSFLCFPLLLSMLPDGLRSGAAADAARPNLILIMADDLGAKELSCYGHPAHRTPHLDRLARTGVQFATCYSTPICHPTRFLIMTGQYGHHSKVFHFAGRPGGPRPDSPEEQIVNHRTFAQVLKTAGYATAMAGKWQLSGQVPTLVRETGFDEYLMWAYKHNLPPGVEHTGDWEGAAGGKTSRYWHPSLVKNGQYVSTGPDMFVDFAIDFAERHKDGPFFIYYPMALTHAPYYSTPATQPNEKEKFRHSKDKFQENVEYMDALVGRLVAALEQMGLREKTVILFTGDNGTGGEGKGKTTERGARVPMIVNGPGIVRPLGLTDELIDHSDVLPTLAELAGASVPDDRPIDGRSFAPQLRGELYAPRDWIYSYLGGQRILRTKRWLLENNSPTSFGQLYDCGTSRDGTGYKEVTGSQDPEVLAVRRQFEEILADKPVPDVSREAPAKQNTQAKKPRAKKKAAQPE
ncbi:MAG: sulfatase-like hydrolase/transferase [Pirellulaceae bacterium]|nr:sulfatase-like hydrolase/transferase [Pirellulaceae bacterium]